MSVPNDRSKCLFLSPPVRPSSLYFSLSSLAFIHFLSHSPVFIFGLTFLIPESFSLFDLLTVSLPDVFLLLLSKNTIKEMMRSKDMNEPWWERMKTDKIVIVQDTHTHKQTRRHSKGEREKSISRKQFKISKRCKRFQDDIEWKRERE